MGKSRGCPDIFFCPLYYIILSQDIPYSFHKPISGFVFIYFWNICIDFILWCTLRCNSFWARLIAEGYGCNVWNLFLKFEYYIREQ